MKAQDIVEQILAMPARQDRVDALARVPESHRKFIKFVVELEFKRNAREKAAASVDRVRTVRGNVVQRPSGALL